MEKMTIDDNMTFEKALDELNSVVKRLSEGKATLDESLSLYKYGTALVEFCNARLASVKQQIEQVNVDTGDTEPSGI